MKEAIEAAQRYDLNNPNSPFYLGKKSDLFLLNEYLHGKKSGYNTNFLGLKKSVLAPARYDHVDIGNKILAEQKTKKWLAGGAIAVAAAFLLRGKIPFIGKFLKKI